MNSDLPFRKKIYIFSGLFLIIILLILNSIFNVVECNWRRDYRSIDDRYFKDVREKIIKLEKEEIKDATTINRLAEQYSLIGKYYLDRQLWDMAIDSFNNSLKYGNKNVNVYYFIGLAYGNRGSEKKSAEDIDKAEANYRRAIELNENFPDAKYALSILLFYYRENGKNEAQSLINGILEKNRVYYPARFAEGRFNYELGNKDKALAIYRALEADLEKLPPSGIINDYKSECKNNISRLVTELTIRQ